MKKFIFKLILELLPIFLYLCWFIIFEPYNYFGLKGDKTGSWATPMARVKEFQRNPSENIILGDSRMNHFDLEYVEKLTGKRYINMGTGGQGITLSKELYEWTLRYGEPKNIVMGASFYQLYGESPSAQSVFYLADHPLEYMVTRDYVLESFDEMLSYFNKEESNKIKEIPIEFEEIIKKDEKYRVDLLEYAFTNIYPVCEGYELPQERVSYFIEIAEDVKNRGGEMLFIAPPVQESIWEYVIEPLELEGGIASYKKKLSFHAKVIDMEWKSEFSKKQEYYSDGFHFSGNKEAYALFTDVIFEKKEPLF